MRNHTHRLAIRIVPVAFIVLDKEGPLIKIKVRALMNKILEYSAIKINANPLLPYSILKPETSSDSPSAKSKGVRLVSATEQTSHINKIGNKINNEDKES